MRKLILFLIVLFNTLGLCAQKVLINGVSWYDDRDSIVSAHGGNMLFDEDSQTFYLFGEYKTDSANVFNGFSCYSSSDLVNWRWEGMALKPQHYLTSRMVGERPKVIKCAETKEYVMLMHSDNRQYKNPCVLYATSKTVQGPYTVQGPLLFEEKPIKKWDIGAFVDDDGRGYLVDHTGTIYRLSSDFHYAYEKVCSGIEGMGEAPAIIHYNGMYYLFTSSKTSWERNDNYYYTAADLAGPWTKRGLFARQGSLTWNSQVSNVFMVRYEGAKFPMYMGSRWSFPRQHSAATYVWLPLKIEQERVSLSNYWQFWEPLYEKSRELKDLGRMDSIMCQTVLSEPGTEINYVQKIKENGRVAITGATGPDGGYAEVVITQTDGWKEVHKWVDFYSKVPSEGLMYLSSKLPKGIYKITIRCDAMRPNWTDKTQTIYGSTGNKVNVQKVYILSE